MSSEEEKGQVAWSSCPFPFWKKLAGILDECEIKCTRLVCKEWKNMLDDTSVRGKLVALRRALDAEISRFCCAGTIENVDKVALHFKSKTGTYHGVSFPDPCKADFDALLESCKPSSFGYGSEDVLDPSYRHAFEMSPDNFTTDLRLAEHSIVQDIQKLMAFNFSVLRPVLYKLNIYPRGGHFKPHVDTPRGDGMIGTLVVGIPHEHQGGQLVVRHGGHEQCMDWSSSPDSPPKVKWGSFFSDCEHEVNPVAQGHRITLTYLLYGSAFPLTRPLSSHDTPIFKTLQAFLGKEVFFEQGGVLGFPCKHMYSLVTLRTQMERPEGFLKGEDAMLCIASRALGLEVQLRPVIQGMEYTEEHTLVNWLGHEFTPNVKSIDMMMDWEDDEHMFQFFYEARPLNPKEVAWCGKLRRMNKVGVALRYGNEAQLSDYYMDAVLLVTIPSYAKRCEKKSEG